MARIPPATRESVPANQRAAYDELIKERGGPILQGPASIHLNSPGMAQRLRDLTAYLHKESVLSHKVQELATLVTARETDCPYVWNAHAGHGRKAGLSDALVNALRDKRDLPRMAPEEASVVNFGREYFRTHRVSDATFQAALRQFGVQGLVELTNIMAYYALQAFNADAFTVDLPASRTEAVLPV